MRIAGAQSEGINKLIEQLENATDPDLIMRLIEFLGKHRQIYETQSSLITQKGAQDDAAKNYLMAKKLGGFNLEKGVSKMTRVTETIEFHQEEQEEIIDGEIKQAGE